MCEFKVFNDVELNKNIKFSMINQKESFNI